MIITTRSIVYLVIIIVLINLLVTIMLNMYNCNCNAQYTEHMTATTVNPPSATITPIELEAIQNIASLYNNSGTLTVPNIVVTGETSLANLSISGNMVLGNVTANSITATTGQFKNQLTVSGNSTLNNVNITGQANINGGLDINTGTTNYQFIKAEGPNGGNFNVYNSYGNLLWNTDSCGNITGQNLSGHLLTLA